MQSPSYPGVLEAMPLVRSSLGSLSYEEELTVCFIKVPNSSEESARSFHLSVTGKFTDFSVWLLFRTYLFVNLHI